MLQGAIVSDNHTKNKMEWKSKQKTGYEYVDFKDIEFFDESTLLEINDKLSGVIEGTQFLKCEMSYKDKAFINGIVRKTSPKTIVEMGLSAGGSSCIILNALKDMPDAKLYSFDYNTDWYREIGKSTCRKTGFLVEQILPNEVHKWELYTGGSPCKYLEKVLPDTGVDICFIDTVHFNPGEHLNILEILPFMKKNGIVIFHDTAYHTMHSSQGFTTCVSINTLEGKRIKLSSESTLGLPNASAIILSEVWTNMPYKLFTNLSLQWHYKIKVNDYRDLLNHFIKYYDSDLVQIFVYYANLYNNIGANKTKGLLQRFVNYINYHSTYRCNDKENAKLIAEKEAMLFRDSEKKSSTGCFGE
jgi:predicted O-methyltransferase YrrM